MKLVPGALVLTLALAACSGPATTTGAAPQQAAATTSFTCDAGAGSLAILVGGRANSAKPSLPALAQALLVTASAARSTISLYRVDGAPTRAWTGHFDQEAPTKTALQQRAEKYAADVTVAFAQVTAKTAEADPLTALSLAARDTAAGGTIVMVDSGLQTVAPLDFASGDLLAASPAEVVASLKARQLLPDLTGRTVVFAGLGDTAAPQATLDNAYRANVVALWTAIAEAGGACVDVDQHPLQGQPAAGLPAVTPVKVPAAPTVEACGVTVLPDSSRVGFTPDTARFRDPAGAREALGALATAAKRPGTRTTLEGTTATAGDSASQLTLSTKRAEAVRAELVALGVPADSITARGVGSTSTYHVKDLDSSGNLVPALAVKNRTVVATLSCG
ncbi:OmpA family protein [Cryptosporangium sp. NPDC048952]|uniref:OmpA family protein n=1 Tax=Cryptosporangium sp. NPDC048952 TaxID=3363961 RepID=UPI003723FC30